MGYLVGESWLLAAVDITAWVWSFPLASPLQPDQWQMMVTRGTYGGMVASVVSLDLGVPSVLLGGVS